MKTTQAPEHRAKDPIARAMVDYLDVPMVFFDAPWPTQGKRIDIVAIDRAGAGDVHVIEIVKNLAQGIKDLPKLLKIPAQFRWFAYPFDPADTKADQAEYDRLETVPLFAPKGMGRVGVILVRPEEHAHGDCLLGEIVVRAERFRGSYHEQVQRFLEKNRPDIEFK